MNIFAKTTKKTPVLTQLGGRELVKNYGDVNTEYEALRNGTIVYDCRTYGVFSIQGENTSDFLEQLSTKDVSFMNVGGVTESYFLDDEASIVSVVFIVKRETDYLVIASWEFADSTLAWLNEKSSDFNVSVSDLSDGVSLISLEGCKSWKTVKDLFNTEIENIALQTIQQFDYMNEQISILRVGKTSEYGYLLLSSPHVGETVYNKVLEYADSSEFPVCEGGLDCIELAMLEVHQPNFPRETKQFGNIFELSQQWYLASDKDGYCGHDAIKKILANPIEKSTVCFISYGEEQLAPGTRILDDGGETIGEVAYSLNSTRDNEIIGIAVMQEPYGQSGLTLGINIDNVPKEITTVSAPIIRPLSWDLKMD